jgi:hypothetical protein
MEPSDAEAAPPGDAPDWPLGHAPLEDAPDRVLQLALQHLSARDLVSARLVSKRMCEQATEPPLWNKVLRRDFQADAPLVTTATRAYSAEQRAQIQREAEFTRNGSGGTVFCDAATLHSFRRYAIWHTCNATWRGRGSQRADHIVAAIADGPVFCVNNVGNDEIACAGGDGIVRIVSLRPPAAPASAKEKEDDPPPRRHRPYEATVRGQFAAHPGIGMLGMSADPQSRTILTGAFSGEASFWRLIDRRPDALAKLSVKALKEQMAARRIPFEDLNEKRELAARLAAHMPTAERLCALQHHPPGEMVVSTSTWRDLCMTGSRDGTARISRVVAGSSSSSYRSFTSGAGAVADASSVPWGRDAGLTWPGFPPPPTGPAPAPASNDCKSTHRAPPPTSDSHLVGEPLLTLNSDASIDVAVMDVRWARAFTGAKDGSVKVWDIRTGVEQHSFDHGDCWVWVGKFNRRPPRRHTSSYFSRKTFLANPPSNSKTERNLG